jgi:hypothetical protein
MAARKITSGPYQVTSSTELIQLISMPAARRGAAHRSSASRTAAPSARQRFRTITPTRTGLDTGTSAPNTSAEITKAGIARIGSYRQNPAAIRNAREGTKIGNPRHELNLTIDCSFCFWQIFGEPELNNSCCILPWVTRRSNRRFRVDGIARFGLSRSSLGKAYRRKTACEFD